MTKWNPVFENEDLFDSDVVISYRYGVSYGLISKANWEYDSKLCLLTLKMSFTPSSSPSRCVSRLVISARRKDAFNFNNGSKVTKVGNEKFESYSSYELIQIIATIQD